MEQQLLRVYDADYARSYDERFIANAHYRVKTEFETETLRRLLATCRPWLDVACGTGWFLSRFPDVPRTGLDLSPAMLEIARRANPHDAELRQGSFLDPIPEWSGRYGLVSCMWYSYGYASSIGALRSLVANLACWTADDGACFVPICDPENLGRGIRVPFRRRMSGYPPAPLFITSVTWTWDEGDGRLHPDMVAPPVEAMVALFDEHFREVEVVRYPAFHWWTRRCRKALIARGKRRA
ncbi:class I SAM-dependent methyltransferase [Candidatus Binatia bacterium]|nr:class I SAM-dependent methyltransferase [Candidatus Binatia bacterium]